MIQPGEDGGFAIELAPTLFDQIGGKRRIGLDLLDGAGPPGQDEIVGLIDGTHTTSADDLPDDIALAEDVIGLE